MKKKNKTEKSLKPSQRESITGFSRKFSSGSDFRSKALRRKIARIFIITVAVLALVYAGFFLADVILRITELPPQDETATTTSVAENITRAVPEAVSPPISDEG